MKRCIFGLVDFFSAPVPTAGTISSAEPQVTSDWLTEPRVACDWLMNWMVVALIG